MFIPNNFLSLPDEEPSNLSGAFHEALRAEKLYAKMDSFMAGIAGGI
jgi:hypothetical protein